MHLNLCIPDCTQISHIGSCFLQLENSDHVFSGMAVETKSKHFERVRAMVICVLCGKAQPPSSDSARAVCDFYIAHLNHLLDHRYLSPYRYYPAHSLRKTVENVG